MRQFAVGGRLLEVVQGDITLIPADAIVNAANDRLIPGGGVDGAIHRAGGPAILADMRSQYGGSRRCATGEAVVTVAGNLPARWVIHAVGPVWAGGHRGEPALLASAYRASLVHAAVLGAATITFPAISCGVFGYPLPDAAQVALETVRAHLAGDGLTSIERATFVLYSAGSLAEFASALELISRR
ncbi:MAG TPA: macro domain-containing protein [Candidatus Sulfomarinibacteraceae bacterium]|nr:macro domain-containing protein [Candidatus Sulfomarinibacteraceae bacterium]